MVKILISRGADMLIADGFGDCLLVVALLGAAKEEVIKTILDAAMKDLSKEHSSRLLCSPGRGGRRPLHIAACIGSPPIVEMLIDFNHHRLQDRHTKSSHRRRER